MKRKLAALLAIMLLLPTFAACSDENADVNDNAADTTADTTAAETTAEPDPFEGINFDGEEFRILVSANDYDKRGSSIYTIRHSEESEGDVVGDAVYTRNLAAEEKLGITFKFIENTDNYTDIQTTLPKTILAGDDAYELVIHDLFSMCSLSVQNYFLNVFDIDHFDFTKEYWYEQYMRDVSFESEDKRYILAGDYFLDILRSAHALYVNKDIYTSLYGAPEELYQMVIDGGWTQEVFLDYIAGAYSDINGDGTADDGDRYGYCTINYWGPMIPWVISSDITFIEFESNGKPYFAMNNERSVALLQRLNDIFYNDGTHNYSTSVEANTTAFIEGHSLFGGYQRVSSIESFRDMEDDIGIIPYPKYDDRQEDYITSSHDTANVGVIPMTCSKADMVGAVVEYLCRESGDYVVPAYYETALKVKYARDDQSSQMLDIIRYNTGGVFALAYNGYCNGLPLREAFSTPLTAQSTDFVSNYTSKEAAAQAKLDEIWTAFSGK